MKKILALLFLSIHALCFGTYYSQCGQDEYIHKHFFNDLKGGTFVDVGAHDGISINNTYFFEKELEWSGICVEPIPAAFNALKANRKSICVEGCVSNLPGDGLFLLISGGASNLSGLIDKYDIRHLTRIQREIEKNGGSYEFANIQCHLLGTILEKENIAHINYLSIDTQGAEYDIISTFDFSKVSIDVISLENTYHDSRFVNLLSDKGFALVKTLNQDMIFANKNFLKKFLQH